MSYNENEKQIFEYRDGDKTKKVDPIVVYNRLLKATTLTDLKADLETFGESFKKTAKPDNGDAMLRLADASSKAFNIPQFDGENGWTVAQLVVLLTTFMQWLTELESFFAQAPISQSPTESASLEPSLTANTSDSGLTDNEPVCASPQ